MKRLFVSIFSILTALSAAAQTSAADSLPLYQRFPFIPPFKLDKASDSTRFVKDDLKKKTATLFILFSPDCEHCQHETKDLLANIDKFKKIQIVMATWLPYADMKKFYEEYKIADYPKITMARDAGFYLPPWFKVTSLPFLAMFNKKGDLITTMEGSVSMQKILEVFQPVPAK